MNHDSTFRRTEGLLCGGVEMNAADGPPPRCKNGWVLTCAMEGSGCRGKSLNEAGSVIPACQLERGVTPMAAGLNGLGWGLP